MVSWILRRLTDRCAIFILCLVTSFLAPSAVMAAYLAEAPDYDSGWVELEPGQQKQLTHYLFGSANDYVVYMDFKAKDMNTINQRAYGGMYVGANPPVGNAANDRIGALWYGLDNTTIMVRRYHQDNYADSVRVRIWKSGAPDYTSGWVAMNPGATSTLNHNLGSSVGDYIVVMDTSGQLGISHSFYGGADIHSDALSDNNRIGAYWSSLSTSSINVTRRNEDTVSPNVRIRIWNRPNPTWDSGWSAVNQGQSKQLTHGIGGFSEDYIVDMQFKYGTADVNQRYFGGADMGNKSVSGILNNNRVGAYWRTLGNNSIYVCRREEDTYAPQMRVRIWRYWRPRKPNWDSGWEPMFQNTGRGLAHTAGGNVDDYFVDMWMRTQSGNINTNGYGVYELATITPQRHGAYWYGLTSSQINVYRAPYDQMAFNARIRIWRMPRADFDSDWQTISPGATVSHSHNLGGGPQTFLVFLMFKDSAADVGINHIAYGGADFNTAGAQGAYWYGLTPANISIKRQAGDEHADQYRLRLWRIAQPRFDTLWWVITPNSYTELDHSLGGKVDNYFVQMYQKDSSAPHGVNQAYWGGNVFGPNPPYPYAEDDEVGTHWSNLSTDKIRLHRRADDSYGDTATIAIWYIPPGVTKSQIIDHILRRHILSADLQEEADCNGDGKINIADLMFWDFVQ